MGKKILLVDDEPDLIEPMKLILKTSGYEIITAQNGAEGIEKARRERPDLILLDLNMPGMDGYEACRKLKLDKLYKDIPVILLTAQFQPNDIRFGTEMGADAYVAKMSEPKVLIAKIEELLKGEKRG
jgi:two-component system alkaline phosphatase synthesis response regulator PhoP